MTRTYAIARWICTRLLGVCVAANYASLLPQVEGLAGRNGITPLAEVMASRTNGFDPALLPRVPSLFWLSTSDAWLTAMTWLGLLAGLCITASLLTRTACAVAWVVGLSFRVVEPTPFLWFNWPFDDMLVEATFLGIFLAPRWSWTSPRRLGDGIGWSRWLALWLLFRLFFGTGFTKVAMGGAWLDHTAVPTFLVTQMFPAVLGPPMQELPRAGAVALGLFTLAVEVAAPWFFFCRGWPARLAASLAMLLMLGLMAAGSFRGFNVLSIGLLLLCFDDAVLRRLLPRRVKAKVEVEPSPPRNPWPGAIVAALVVAASVGPMAEQLTGRRSDELPLVAARGALQPFHLANNYFMFCALPAERLGLVVQGSRDGEHWLDYEPRHLVAAVARRPRWFAPMTDHLGFALWLASYGPPAVCAHWLPRLLDRLRAGEPSVRRLFAVDPFGDTPPAHVRAALFRFSFAPPEDRARGTWWRRELLSVHAVAR